MKVIEIYQEYKEKYPDYFLLIKVGKFYEVYFSDTKLIHMIMGYKIRKTASDIPQVGFPSTSLAKVMKELIKRKVNYMILEKDETYKITEKKRFQKNQYQEITQQFSKEYQTRERIERIYHNLLERIEDNHIHDILTEVERVYGR